MKEQNRIQSQAVITVSDPQVRKQYGGAKQYYLYTIKGHDTKGPIDIQRRYSDFDSLRNLLIRRWPGCYIPSLPSKVKLAHSDEQFLEIRSKYLQKFLSEISLKTFLWHSDEMQIFLRNKMTDFDKVVTNIWKVQPQELLYRYELNFNNIEGEQQAKMQQKIQEFNKYLQVLNVKIQQLRNRSEEINNAQAKYQKKYSKFLLNVLNSYEEKFIYFYNQNNKKFNPIFSSPQNCQKKVLLEQSLKQAPMKILFQQLKREKREILAIQQAIKEYEQYIKQKAKLQGKIKEHEIKLDQLKNGKKSFFAKIRNVSTDDQISSHEKSIQKYKAELQRYVVICSYIKKILYVNEIESFKKERTTSYYHMVRQIAQEQLNIIEKQSDFWHSVLNNNNFNFQIEDQINKEPKDLNKQFKQQKITEVLQKDKMKQTQKEQSVIKVLPKLPKQEAVGQVIKQQQKNIQIVYNQQTLVSQVEAFKPATHEKDKEQDKVTKQEDKANEEIQRSDKQGAKDQVKQAIKTEEQAKLEFVQIQDD